MDPGGKVRVVAYWYAAGSGTIPIYIPCLGSFYKKVTGYHIGIGVEDNMGSRRTDLWCGGPERYQTGNWGDLMDKHGYVGDKKSQDDGHLRAMAITLVNDFSRISAQMDRKKKYGFPGPNSNSWARELIDGAGLGIQFKKALSKRALMLLPEPWAPGFNDEVIP